jgi:hypothetical protein
MDKSSILISSSRLIEEEKKEPENLADFIILKQMWSEAFTRCMGPLWSHKHACEAIPAWIKENPDHMWWSYCWWSDKGTSYAVLKKV